MPGSGAAAIYTTDAELYDRVHRLAARTPAEWLEAIARTSFCVDACHDGAQPDRPRRPADAPGHMLWYELVARPG